MLSKIPSGYVPNGTDSPVNYPQLVANSEARRAIGAVDNKAKSEQVLVLRRQYAMLLAACYKESIA